MPCLASLPETVLNIMTRDFTTQIHQGLLEWSTLTSLKTWRNENGVKSAVHRLCGLVFDNTSQLNRQCGERWGVSVSVCLISLCQIKLIFISEKRSSAYRETLSSNTWDVGEQAAFIFKIPNASQGGERRFHQRDHFNIECPFLKLKGDVVVIPFADDYSAPALTQLPKRKKMCGCSETKIRFSTVIHEAHLTPLWQQSRCDLTASRASFHDLVFLKPARVFQSNPILHPESEADDTIQKKLTNSVKYQTDAHHEWVIENDCGAERIVRSILAWALPHTQLHYSSQSDRLPMTPPSSRCDSNMDGKNKHAFGGWTRLMLYKWEKFAIDYFPQ